MSEQCISGMVSFEWVDQDGNRPRPNLQTVDPRLGLGYNSITEETKNVPALAETNDPAVSKIPNIKYQIDKIEDRESLRSTLSVSVSASYGDITGSGNASVKMYHELTTQAYSLFVLIRVIVTVKEVGYKSGQLNVVPGLKELAEQKDYYGIANLYGDSYISSIVYGGEYYVLLNLSTNDSSEYESMSVAVSAAVGGFSGGASLESTVSKLRQYSHLTVSQVIDGIITPIPNWDEVEKYAREFATKVEAAGGKPVICKVSPLTGSNWPAGFKLDYRKEKKRVRELIEILKKIETIKIKWLHLSGNVNQYTDLTREIVDEKLNGLSGLITKITDEIEDIDFEMGNYHPSELPTYDLSGYEELPTLIPVLRPRIRSTWIDGAPTALPQQQDTNVQDPRDLSLNWIRSSGGHATSLFGLAIEFLDLPEGLELWMRLYSGSPNPNATEIAPSHILQRTINGEFISGVTLELRGAMANLYYLEYMVHCNKVGNSEIWGNTPTSKFEMGDYARKELYPIQGLRVVIYPR